MADEQAKAQWSEVEFQGKMIVDINGHKIGKFQDVDVDVDVETDIPQFVTVKEGIIGRHLTFVPLGGIQIGPDDLRVPVTKEQGRIRSGHAESFLSRRSQPSITTSS